MKKSIKFALVGALLLALVLMLGSCNLSDIPEELVGMIPDEIKNLHEHPWDEWAMVYGEGDVSLVCNVCKATVKTQPFSEGLDIRDGVLYGIGTCTDKEIVVPYGVTEVAKDAFQGASIKGILLPDTLKSIGNDAFKNCQFMAVIHFPNGLEFIGERAFQNCKALVAIVLPNSVKTLGAHSFENCQLLGAIYYYGVEEDWEKVEKGKDWNKGAGKHAVTYKGVVIAPDGPNPDHESQGLAFELNEDGQSYSVVGIGTCTDTDVVIPSEYKGLPVTSIGDSAFMDCSLLTSIVLPDSVKTLGQYGSGVFSGCEALTEITIGSGVENIPDLTFQGTYSLVAINVSPNNEHYKSINGHLYTKDGKTFVKYAGGKTDTIYTVLDGVTYISDYAFSWCNLLTEVIIPGSVNNIGLEAFQYNLLINIDVSVNNTNYKSIDGNLYSKDGTTLVKYAMGKTDTSFIIPTGVTTIEWHAFSCSNFLTNITIPNTVTTINHEAFTNCISLTSITIPGSVINIWENAFSECTSLTSVIISDGVTSIGNAMFQNCYSLTDIVIPDSVTSIGSYAFLNCKSLTNIELPSSITTIEDGAFCQCYLLTSIVIPKSVKNMGDGVFSRCDSLTIYCESESLPNGWDSTWNNSNCPIVWGYKSESDTDTNFSKGLEYELNPDGQSYSVVGIGTCTDTDIVFPSEYNGLPVTKIGKDALDSRIFGWDWYDKTISITIPDSVTEIGTQAFFSGLHFSSINLGNGLKIIGEDAFWGSYCEELYIPASVTTIKSLTFHEFWDMKNYIVDENNPNYKSIDGNLYSKDGKTFIVYAIAKEETTFTIPTHVTTIEAYAFCSNYNLKSIYVHSGVTTIGYEAFSRGLDFESVYYDGTVAQWYSICNFYDPSNITFDYTIYCTDGTIAKDGTVTYYTNSDNVSEGLEYELNADGQSYSVVGIGAFTGDELVVPAFYNGKPVTGIGTGAFCHCDWILSITLPETIRNIGHTAFADCFELLSINIPRFISNLPPHLFGCCTKLKNIEYSGTVEEWNNLSKGESWNGSMGSMYGYCNVNCKDGTITYN